jgi:pSer/pThr/pTyr-binding forkhead associated (FHA) protein
MSQTLYLRSRTLCSHDIEVEPTAAPAVIGRGIDADIRPSFHHMLSRRHCRVIWTGTRWLLEDLGSTHGTFVNGDRLNGNVVALVPGDTIMLAHEQVTYTVC